MARHLHLLAAAVTDRTFERTRLDDRPVWVGKCIHCNSKLVVADDGRSLGEATLEHIIPQTRGEFKRSSQHLKEDCDEETQTLRASRTCAAEVTRETVSAT